MARKGWGSLSPAYRGRLEKAGLSRQDYEAGASLSEARGHQTTPEHPRSFDPGKYPAYAAERSRLTRELEEKKERMFGGQRRWNADRASRYIREKPPSIRQLRWAVDEADEEDLLDAIREDPSAFQFLGYH